MSAYGSDACRWCEWWTPDERDLEFHVCSVTSLRESIDVIRNENEQLQWRLTNLANKADVVMLMLEEFGPSIVPHLIDTDENPGERLRAAIREVQRCSS